MHPNRGFLPYPVQWRAHTGGARGKITFQAFSDFLLGLNAADNLILGRNNIQTVQASEGVGSKW